MTQEGKKIGDMHENQIDVVLVKLCKHVSEPLHKIGFTPNMITIIGMILGSISIYLLINKKYTLSIIFLWLTYWSDCLDGYMARKYNQITKLGDYLDHFRDVFVFGSIVILILMNLQGGDTKILAGIIISIFAIMMMYHMGCQESISNCTEHNDCLDFFRKLCGDNPREEIKITKNFGCGTFVTVLSAFIFILKLQDPN